nr:UPF0158 family protein [uncultured Holophaga sp.]
MTQVAWMDLLDAYDFANLGAEYEHRAYIDRVTGRIYFASEDSLPDDDQPEDWSDPDRYLEMPRASDLELGVYTVLDFVAKHLPQDYGTVSNFFQQAGAYGRFKGLMERRGRLDQWFSYEADATANALRSWCRRNGLEPIHTPTRGAS